jgi:centractin
LLCVGVRSRRCHMEGSCLVLDCGSGYVKAELCGDEVTPKRFPNVCGTLKYSGQAIPTRVEGLANDSDTLVGLHVNDQTRGLLRLSYPMEHGHVVDWRGMNQVFRHTVSTLNVAPKGHPVLISEAPHTSKLQREKMAQFFFEELHVPALLFSVQAVLSLYASGHCTGVVLDVGDGVTHACPVFEGYTIKTAAQRVDFGGRDITRYLQLLLRRQGCFLDSTAEFEIVREIKEQRCCVSSDLQVDLKSVSPVRHLLPDGTEVNVGPARFRAPEALFNPSLIGLDFPGVTDVLVDSIRRSDIDIRRALCSAVYIAGGSTLFENFTKRLMLELRRSTPKDVSLKIFAPTTRMDTAWIGGNILAQLTSFRQLLAKKKDYDEQGPAALRFLE